MLHRLYPLWFIWAYLISIDNDVFNYNILNDLKTICHFLLYLGHWAFNSLNLKLETSMPYPETHIQRADPEFVLWFENLKSKILSIYAYRFFSGLVTQTWKWNKYRESTKEEIEQWKALWDVIGFALYTSSIVNLFYWLWNVLCNQFYEPLYWLLDTIRESYVQTALSNTILNVRSCLYQLFL